MGLTHISSSCRAADGLELMVLKVRQPFGKEQALMAQAPSDGGMSLLTWSEGEQIRTWWGSSSKCGHPTATTDYSNHCGTQFCANWLVRRTPHYTLCAAIPVHGSHMWDGWDITFWCAMHFMLPSPLTGYVSGVQHAFAVWHEHCPVSWRLQSNARGPPVCIPQAFVLTANQMLSRHVPRVSCSHACVLEKPFVSNVRS